MNATSWSACEKLTRVHPKFTRVLVICPCEQNRVEPGLVCTVSVKHGLSEKNMEYYNQFELKHYV